MYNLFYYRCLKLFSKRNKITTNFRKNDVF